MRHIRDIHHLRPVIIGDDGLVKIKRTSQLNRKKGESIINNEDPCADVNLIKHMVKVSQEFMEGQVPNNQEGYLMGFHKPPINSQYHLHMHLVVLPFKNKIYEWTHGKNLTPP